MKQYKFLLKPLFFVFNLLFATWLVLKIEKISPSDLGEYRSLFEKTASPAPQEDPLVQLCISLKKGEITREEFDKRLGELLNSPGSRDKSLTRAGSNARSK